MNVLRMEFFKSRRRKIWLIPLCFLAVQLVWVETSIQRMEPEVLGQGWVALIYNCMLLDAIMLPIAIATLASRMCEMEHKGSTLRLLETITTSNQLYFAKLTWGGIQLACLLLLRTGMFFLLGLHAGFPSDIPYGKFGLALLVSFAVSMTIYVLQQSLSLLWKNQAFPLIMGVCGSFVGLLSMFFPLWVQRCSLWSYYGVLTLAGMDWEPNTRVTTFFWRMPAGGDVILLLGFFIVILVIGHNRFARKEG